MLTSLIDLASESDSDKRRQILGYMVGLFIAGADRYSDEDLTLFNGVIKRLADLADDREKETLSRDLAPINETSHDLVMRLASETLPIAKYMLRYSQVLTRDDLLHLAKVKGQGHLLAISQRKKLEARVTDVLLERGERPVRRSVASNPGADLSDWGTRFLVKLAEKDEVLRETMLERRHLTPQHFDKLIEQLPSEQSAKMRHLYKTNEKLAEEMFHEAGQIVAHSKLDRKRSRIDTKVSLQDIRADTKSLNQVFTEYAFSSNFLDLSFLLADLGQIDQKYVINVMARMEIDGIAILCKALDIGPTEFGTFCKARSGLLKLSAKVADGWISEYKVLKTPDAQRALRFIKVRLKTMESEAA